MIPIETTVTHGGISKDGEPKLRIHKYLSNPESVLNFSWILFWDIEKRKTYEHGYIPSKNNYYILKLYKHSFCNIENNIGTKQC